MSSSITITTWVLIIMCSGSNDSDTFLTLRGVHKSIPRFLQPFFIFRFFGLVWTFEVSVIKNRYIFSVSVLYLLFLKGKLSTFA